MIVSRAHAKTAVVQARVAEHHDEDILVNPYISRLLESELLDLYAAILIAVPVAFFLKSLWF
ncbi:MAG: hypothetical protein JSR47_15935 [Proteobacteria bacterium]|nr:hypothetical protein [Pseudomonadota bacterium]MBS0546277.1 hypothetical protein [Pseudomonadota bacterium]